MIRYPVWAIETDSDPIGVSQENCFLNGRTLASHSVDISAMWEGDMLAIRVTVAVTLAVEILINYELILENLPH